MNLKKELMNFLQSLDGDELRNLADGSLTEEMAVDAYLGIKAEAKQRAAHHQMLEGATVKEKNCNDNCGHQNEEICNTCPDLCCGMYPPPAEKVERFEKVAEWISVKDRLPERNQNVLIAREKPFHTYLLTAFQRDGVFHSNQDAIMLGKVTHWMPLPKPPVK